MIAIDFDNTLIDIHTHSNWELPPSELLPHIRPVFLKLIPKWIHEGKNIAIVTFSNQSNIIKDLLKLAFPDFDFFIWAELPKSINSGKSKHIEKACQYYNIPKSEVLFIDDSKNNIDLAIRNGINSIFFDVFNKKSTTELLLTFDNNVEKDLKRNNYNCGY